MHPFFIYLLSCFWLITTGNSFAANELLYISPKDRTTKWSVGGRLQLDRTQFHNDSNTDFNNSWNTRRARLSNEINFYDTWILDLTYDFARDGISGVRDAFLEYRGFDAFWLRAGHFKEPFSMERLTSVRDLAFMERSLVTEIAPERSVGLAMHRARDYYTIGWGVFTGNLDQGSDIIRYSVSGRATIAPRNQDGDILHAGVSAAYRELEAGKTLQFRQRPETRSNELRLIDTGDLITNAYWLYSFEAAIARDNLALQAEYIQSIIPNARANSFDLGQQLNFSGWHIDGIWILSGEPQPYNPEKGTLGRLRPLYPVNQGGSGAWKVGIRFSELDLNDHFVRGGRQQNLTLGLTWVLNQNLSLMMEHIKVIKIDEGDFVGAALALTQARIQILF